MHAATNAIICRASFLRKLNLTLLLAIGAAFFATSSGRAQNPMAPQAAPTSPTPATSSQPSPAQPSSSPANAGLSQPSPASGPPPTFATPPVAIVPIDNSNPGAALSVAGPMQ